MRALLARLPRRPWTAALTAAVLSASALTVMPASGADTGCRVDYTVNKWADGYTAQIKVTNLGPALDGWR
ncbi:hypothetical protein GCM10023238_32720 [Streptomyces heliomycini]